MSEEKARAQEMRFRDLSAMIEVIDAAYDEGVRAFACTTHNRIAELCDHFRAHADRYPELRLYPGMPYAHKYANAVTEEGMLGAVRGFLPDQSLLSTAIGGGSALARKDVESLTKMLIDAEMGMFNGLTTPVIFLQNVVTDLLLGLGFNEAFRMFSDHVRERYGAQPGFFTMNLPRLAEVLTAQGIEDAAICANINKIGFRMSGGVEAYQRVMAEGPFTIVAMSVFASGAIAPREAIEWVSQQQGVDSILFGASSRGNIAATRRLVDEFFGPVATGAGQR
jgi:hypothetical protein